MAAGVRSDHSARHCHPCRRVHRARRDPDRGEWNYWIIYPAIAWVPWTAAHAWWAYGRKPISEAEIKHEIDRQAGQGR
jgi:hypothetical protein